MIYPPTWRQHTNNTPTTYLKGHLYPRTKTKQEPASCVFVSEPSLFFHFLLASKMTSFIVAGGMGAVVNYAIFSQYLPSTDYLLKEFATVTNTGEALLSMVQPLTGLSTFLPAIFGFLGGTLLLFIWNWLKSIVVRRLLEYDGWMLRPKNPINKIWMLLMMALLGTKNKGSLKYQDCLPSLPVPPLKSTCKKYLKSVKPLLSEEDYNQTEAAVQEFMKKDGKKLQFFLTLRSWRMRNWIGKWWVDFIYLRQRTPICFNSNYYAVAPVPKCRPDGLDRASEVIFQCLLFYFKQLGGKIENAMGGKVAPFCMKAYKNLVYNSRVPGEEMDTIASYGDEKPKHAVVLRQGKFYMIEVCCPITGRVHQPKTLKKQLQKVIDMAGDVQDETGLAAFTSLPRTQWARIRQRMEKRPSNKSSLKLIDSSAYIVCLDTEDSIDDMDYTAVGNHLFHGNGFNRWFDKGVQLVCTPNSIVGANVEHSMLDATVCGQLWEYMLTEESYDANGGLLEREAGQFVEGVVDTPNPSPLEWELDDFRDDLKEAKENVARMIDDSDLFVVSTSYGKRFPKKMKLSPDGWFQMAMQLAYYRLHKKFVLTYESATTRFYYEGRTETIRPLSEYSVAFVKSFDDPSVPREEVKKMLKNAIEYQCNYKFEAMRGLGVDRHLFGLYIIAKGMNLDPMPKMFTDKAFNLSFELSTSQTPVRCTTRWRPETTTRIGGFGAVTDVGYGISYIVADEDEVNFSVHSKRSCPDTSSTKMGQAILQVFEDMRQLYTD